MIVCLQQFRFMSPLPSGGYRAQPRVFSSPDEYPSSHRPIQYPPSIKISVVENSQNSLPSQWRNSESWIINPILWVSDLMLKTFWQKGTAFPCPLTASLRIHTFQWSHHLLFAKIFEYGSTLLNLSSRKCPFIRGTNLLNLRLSVKNRLSLVRKLNWSGFSK